MADTIVEKFSKATTTKEQAQQVADDHVKNGDKSVVTDGGDFWIVTTTPAAPAADDPS